jgi:CheY-like chemotaxis protein
MSTTILLIHRQLSFAVTVKQALERTKRFDVHPFVSVDSAVEYLATHPQDIAVVDFEMPSASGDEIVVLLRDTQANIPIIATPIVAESVMNALALQGSVESRFSARDLIPIIDNVITVRRTGTLTPPPTPEPEEEQSGLLTRIVPTTTADLRPPPAPPPAQGEAGKTDVLPKTREQSNFPEPDFSVPLAPFPPLPDEEEDVPTLLEFDAGQTRGTRESPAVPVDPSALFADLTSWAGDPTADLFGTDEQDDDPYDDDDQGNAFDDVLSSIDPASQPSRARNTFDDMLDSLRSEQPQEPLPARQQFLEFTLASGMDSLVEQIERKRSTDQFKAVTPESLPEYPEDLPDDSILPDEPPMPSFEDSGTVGDLITGINDSGFKNVLSILRGEQVTDEELDALLDQHAGRRDDTDDFLSELEADLGIAPTGAPAKQEFDFDSLDFTRTAPNESTPARVILETALDPNQPSETFSISDLLDSIEAQLPDHKPNVQPLPSWVREDEIRQKGSLSERIARRDQPEAPATLPEVPASQADLTVPHQPDAAEQTADYATVADELPGDFDELLEQMDAPADDPDAYAQTTMANTSQAPFHDMALQETMAAWDDAPAEPEDLPELPQTWDEPDEAPVQAWDDSPADEPDTPDVAQRPVLAEAPPAAAPADLPEPPRAPGYDTEFDRMAAYEVEIAPDEEPQIETTHVDDPYIAQLALSLTTASLEMAADATLITRDNQIVAYAGRMPREELLELAEGLNHRWDAPANGVSVRYGDLDSTGKRYLIYGRRTVDDMSLTIIISGSTRLTAIRQQSERLLTALRAVPDMADPALEDDLLDEAGDVLEFAPGGETLEASQTGSYELDESITRTPLAFVWALRDPSAALPKSTAQAIRSGLKVQLREQLWHVRDIRARDEYVYVLADVPGDDPPYRVVRELKQRAASIAHAQNRSLSPDHLWAPSYMIVTPGRPLEEEEIRQLVSLDRM